MKKLIESFEFTSNNKFIVNVYENRVEVESSGAGNLLNKGVTGTSVFFLKHLTSIEYKFQGKTTGYIEFLVAGYGHLDSTMNKVRADNVVLFNQKETEKAKRLIDLINNLID